MSGQIIKLNEISILASLSLQCCEHFKNRPELSARTWKLRGERSVREMFIFQCGNFLPLDIPRVTGATLSVWTPDSRSPDNSTYYMAHISIPQRQHCWRWQDCRTVGEGGLREVEWREGQEWRALTGAKLALLSIFSSWGAGLALRGAGAEPGGGLALDWEVPVWPSLHYGAVRAVRWQASNNCAPTSTSTSTITEHQSPN